MSAEPAAKSAESQEQQLTATRAKGWTTVDYVLIVVTAAIYAAALLTLAQIKIAPGTSLRPGNALQSVFGVLFGLPGSIGVGLGNLLNDLYQGAPPHAMVVGLFANFLGGFIPYLVVSHPNLVTKRSWIEWLVGVVLLTSAVIGYSIYINVWLGLTPAKIAAVFAPVVFFNQAIPSLILSPILLKLLYPYVKRSGLFRGREV